MCTCGVSERHSCAHIPLFVTFSEQVQHYYELRVCVRELCAFKQTSCKCECVSFGPHIRIGDAASHDEDEEENEEHSEERSARDQT